MTQCAYTGLTTSDGAAIGSLCLQHRSGAEEMLVIYGCNASLDMLQYLAGLINTAISSAASPEPAASSPIENELTLSALVDLDRVAACMRFLPKGADDSTELSLEAEQSKVLQRLSSRMTEARAELALLPKLITPRIQVDRDDDEGSLSISLNSTYWIRRGKYSMFVYCLLYPSLLLLLSPVLLLAFVWSFPEDKERIFKIFTLLTHLGILGCEAYFVVALFFPRPRKVTLMLDSRSWRLAWLVECGCLPWCPPLARGASGPLEDLVGCKVCFTSASFMLYMSPPSASPLPFLHCSVVIDVMAVGTLVARNAQCEVVVGTDRRSNGRLQRSL